MRYLVTDAIERQLVSDVPIGTFLSGGLDSSLISAVAAKHLEKQGKTLSTFSVTYKDQAQYFKANRFQHDTDDAAITTMVQALHSDNHTIELDTPQLVEALYAVAESRALRGMADVVSLLVCVCSEITTHVTVALSGT